MVSINQFVSVAIAITPLERDAYYGMQNFHVRNKLPYFIVYTLEFYGMTAIVSNTFPKHHPK